MHMLIQIDWDPDIWKSITNKINRDRIYPISILIKLSLKCLDQFELAPYGKFDGLGSIAIKRIDDLARVHSVKFKIVWEIFKVTVNL